MPFPFTLPTTSSFSFSEFFSSDSHPSLPLATSTSRGVLRDTLKKHKHLTPVEQASHLSSVFLGLTNYIPYLIAIDRGLGSQLCAGKSIDVVLKSALDLQWRPTLSHNPVPGRDVTRIQINSLEYEIYFTLSSLAYTYTLLSRVALNPLYSQSKALPSAEERTHAITTATKHLLAAGSIHEYLSTRSEQLSTPAPCIDLSQSSFKALASLALAEATLLAVLKDDPYPTAVAQDRNRADKEWMIKAPEIPKVRAHLFARLCLAAAEHATNTLSLLKINSPKSQRNIDTNLLNYVKKLKRCSQGKACRFFGIDAELGGEMGKAIAWLQAGIHQLGLTPKDYPIECLGKIKKVWDEKREENKVESGTDWGNDAGIIEEGRVLEMLKKKWSKANDMINAQSIPPVGPLLASMPSGREIHILKPFVPPSLEISSLEGLRVSCFIDEPGVERSSDEGEDNLSHGNHSWAKKW
ncbi:pH-response regulator protein [Podosphaera aphanis]|nr:pH-response regulator protein [Podosphaera aphanis]